MCFSAEASFGAGATLLPVGAFCVSQAIRKDRRFLPLALVPVAFGAQQAAEGFVWLGLHHDDVGLVAKAGVVFLFFALAFWPVWIPLSLLFVEVRQPVKVVLAVTSLLSLVWVWLFVPLAVDSGRWLSTEIVEHSIAYHFDDLPAFQLVPRIAWRVAYLAFICVPLVVARPGNDDDNRLRLLGGGLVAMLFAVSYGIYWYAFTSVWCFFAALASLLLGFVFFQLPRRGVTNLPGNF